MNKFNAYSGILAALIAATPSYAIPTAPPVPYATMRAKAQAIISSINNSAGKISTIAAPLNPVESVYSGTIKAIPAALNASATVTGFGGIPTVNGGDGTWQNVGVSSGYGYLQASRGTAWATSFDGTSLQVIYRAYTAKSMSHRLMVNGQWVTSVDQSPPQWTGYISNGTSGTAGNTLNVTSVQYGKLYAGMTIGGVGVTSATLSFGGTGTGGVGTYTISGSTQNVGTSASPVAMGDADNVYTMTYDLSQFGAAGVLKNVVLYADENFAFRGFSSTTTTDTFAATPIPILSIAESADSYGDAQQDSFEFGGLRGGLQEQLGTYVAPQGLGGQGFVNSGGQPTKLAQIVTGTNSVGDAALGLGKDLYFLFSSVNDIGASATTLTANITTSLQTMRAANPAAFIVFVNAFRSTNKDPGSTLYAAADSGCNAVAATDPYMLCINGYSADGGLGWTRLTGATANIGIYQDADGTHQNTNGYRYLTSRIMQKVTPWLDGFTN